MHYLLMLHKRSQHMHSRFKTPMRHAIMISGYAGEEVVKPLEKAGAGNFKDAKGLKPMEYIEAPLAAQIELKETARWIGDNEERYRLRGEVISYHFNNLKISDAELAQSRVDRVFEKEPKWRIVPDEVSASPSWPD